MDWNTPHLSVLLSQAWEKLEQALIDTNNPWRWPVLGTINGSRPALRTMVLREVDRDARKIVCYTDIRSDKVQHMLACPHVEWLFYDAPQGLQLRANGSVVVHHNDTVTEAAWKNRPAINHLHYLSPLPPGTSLPATLPEPPALGETELAFQNFAVVVTTINLFDILMVAGPRDKRAAFMWDGSAYVPTWLVA